MKKELNMLVNKNLEKQLLKNGYVTVPFLTDEELAALQMTYSSIHQGEDPPRFIDGIHMTTWCEDQNYKFNVRDQIKEITSKATERFFKNVRSLNQVFIVKKPNQGTTFKVHQDWNVTDEKENFALNIWIPLQDVNEQNGALWILEKSHRIKRNVRGSAYLFPDYSPHFNEIEKAAKSIPLKAGQAVVFFLNTIHGSPANLSEQDRKVACFSVIPEHAPLTIYFQKQAGDDLEVHEPDDEFMYRYKSLRTDTLEIGPTENAKRCKSFINEKVNYLELRSFLKPSIIDRVLLKFT